MFYVLTLPSIRYVKEAILPLRNFCLCLLSWQELTLFPAIACHSPGNVTKCFSEVHFSPIPSCYFPPKQRLLARVSWHELTQKVNCSLVPAPQITCSLIANVTSAETAITEGQLLLFRLQKNLCPQHFMLKSCQDFLFLLFLRRGHT